MNYISIFFIALALAMDAFAVSISCGADIKRSHFKRSVTAAFSFGFFQAVMPLIGWAAGMSFVGFIGSIDHWIIFFLMLFIGLKMIFESGALKEKPDKINFTGYKFLLVMSVATSLDALAVGLSLSILKIEIFTPALTIGFVTFVLCLAGCYIGRVAKHIFSDKIEIIGGLILIIIGTKILVQHLIK